MYGSGAVGSGISAEMFETAPQLFPGECVLIVGEVGNGRDEILQHRPKPDGRSEVAARAGLRRSAHHADRRGDSTLTTGVQTHLRFSR